MSKISLKSIFRWILVIIWCGGIFYFSHQPFLESGLGIWDFFLRKLAHIFEFGILTFLVFWALGLDFKKSLWVSGIFSFLYAVLDEYHQTYIPGRNGNLADVGIDGVGILIATILIWGKKRKKN